MQTLVAAQRRHPLCYTLGQNSAEQSAIATPGGDCKPAWKGHLYEGTDHSREPIKSLKLAFYMAKLPNTGR